jgi:molybdate transport system substrate-binding protein
MLALFVIAAVSTFAAEIHAMTSAALTESYNNLIPEFERATHNKVVTTFGGDDLPGKLENGEPADVMIIWRADLDKLVKRGLVVQDSEVDLVRSLIGVAVRTGSPKPDISSVDALRRTLLNARSIAYSNSISGRYISKEMLPKLGIADQVKDKCKQIVGMRVGVAVARGDAEIGLQQISELLPIKGIDYIGPVPDDIQLVTYFSAGIVTGGKNRPEVKALVHFLTSSPASTVFVKHGLEPASIPIVH